MNHAREIENGDVEGASWGVHDGQFYGYKVYLVIDTAIELSVVALLATGKQTTNGCSSNSRFEYLNHPTRLDCERVCS